MQRAGTGSMFFIFVDQIADSNGGIVPLTPTLTMYLKLLFPLMTNSSFSSSSSFLGKKIFHPMFVAENEVWSFRAQMIGPVC
jgi:hypothetical protein